MPLIKHCSHVGAWKERLALMKSGDFLDLSGFQRANSFRATARAIGLRVSVRRIGPGPAYRVTIDPPIALKVDRLALPMDPHDPRSRARYRAAVLDRLAMDHPIKAIAAALGVSVTFCRRAGRSLGYAPMFVTAEERRLLLARRAQPATAHQLAA